MSLLIYKAVWKHTKHSGSELATMLALADVSNDHGFSFHSVGSLAKMCRTTRRNMTDIIARLKDSGEIKITPYGGKRSDGNPGRSPNLYEVVLGKPPKPNSEAKRLGSHSSHNDGSSGNSSSVIGEGGSGNPSSLIGERPHDPMRNPSVGLRELQRQVEGTTVPTNRINRIEPQRLLVASLLASPNKSDSLPPSYPSRTKRRVQNKHLSLHRLLPELDETTITLIYNARKGLKLGALSPDVAESIRAAAKKTGGSVVLAATQYVRELLAEFRKF